MNNQEKISNLELGLSGPFKENINVVFRLNFGVNVGLSSIQMLKNCKIIKIKRK